MRTAAPEMWIEGNVCYVCTRLNLTCQLIELGSVVTIDQGSTIYRQLYALASLCLPRQNASIALLVYLHVGLHVTGTYIFKHDTTNYRVVSMCRLAGVSRSVQRAMEINTDVVAITRLRYMVGIRKDQLSLYLVPHLAS